MPDEGTSSSCIPVSEPAPSDLPRRRKVEVSSHTSSPAECTSVTMSKTLPLGWPRRPSGRAVTCSDSLAATGRCWVMEFSRCTVPMAGKGKSPSVMIAMCSGKASMWG